MERNSYHSIARMKYENTKPIEFVDMGYKKEEEEATNTFEMHFIELPKFKQKNPDCNTKLEQWLWLIDGSKEVWKRWRTVRRIVISRAELPM